MKPEGSEVLSLVTLANEPEARLRAVAGLTLRP